MLIQRNIMIVDDSEINRKMLCKILEKDYKVVQAENGQVALDILRSDKAGDISVILLDLVMPVLDGYEFLKIIKKEDRLKSIPVIVATQLSGEEKELEALKLGAADFVAKPYVAQIIRQRISNTIELRESAALINAVEKDYLTNVYNRDFFVQKLGKILKNHPRTEYDLICSDIENFKLINDIIGADTCDKVLCYLVDVMKEFLGGPELVGRLESDNIIILVKRPYSYSEELFRAVNKKFNQFPTDVNLRVRFGIYPINNKDFDLRMMCERASFAAKSIKGKFNLSYAVYDDKLRDKVVYNQSLLADMEQALEEKQFKIHLQPKYNLATGQLAGAEVLVRWQHPKYGMIYPGDFIPLFEQSGFISFLDTYVWEETCVIMKRIIDKGYPLLPISVNVSRIDLYKKELPDLIYFITKQYGIETKYLHLEITESAYTDNPQQIIEAVKRLKERGFIIEMDDFGSGYSSLNMLGELPIDILKLDMKFIQSEFAKDGSKNILSFIISLSKWLGLLVVAEGVETKEQVKRLYNMECNYVQGYYYAKPMPEKDFFELLAKGNIDTESMSKSSHSLYVSKKVIETKKDANKKNMLIVDDIELNRTILKEIFRDSFNIIEADNGKTALDYLMQNSGVDIIMVDLIMPQMDGYQLLRKVKESSPLKDIPVIVTSQTGEESEIKALEMGADDFISKPYTPVICQKRVYNVLRAQNIKK